MRWIAVLDMYKTTAGQGSAEIVVKKSRFVGGVYPVESSAAADEKLALVREEFRDASHTVFGYVIGADGLTQRYSDDGEPSGTAGVPVLEVLKKLELTNVLVTVTRYFGGTLLGRGGLVRAYGAAAKAALMDAGVVRRVPYEKYAVTVEYGLSGKVENELRGLGIRIDNVVYQADVMYTLVVHPQERDRVHDMLQEITAAGFLWEIEGEVYVDEPWEIS